MARESTSDNLFVFSGGFSDFSAEGETISFFGFLRADGGSRVMSMIADCGGCGAFDDKMSASRTAWIERDRGIPIRSGSLRRIAVDLKAVMGWRNVSKRKGPVTELVVQFGWSNTVSS